MAETTHTEVGASPAPKREFPPFDATTFVPQLFWLAVTFTILYVALERLVLPRIAFVLGDRQAHIANDLDVAKQLSSEADATLKAYEKAIGEARARAAAISVEARARIKAEADKRKTEVDAELARQIEAAEATIATAKAAALAGVRTVAVDVAGAIVEKVLHERASPSELGRAVDDELKAA